MKAGIVNTYCDATQQLRQNTNKQKLVKCISLHGIRDKTSENQVNTKEVHMYDILERIFHNIQIMHTFSKYMEKGYQFSCHK